MVFGECREAKIKKKLKTVATLSEKQQEQQQKCLSTCTIRPLTSARGKVCDACVEKAEQTLCAAREATLDTGLLLSDGRVTDSACVSWLSVALTFVIHSSLSTNCRC